MTYIILGIYVLMLGGIAGMWYRNSQVFKLRNEIIDKVFSYSDWPWRRDVYKSVSYNEMMLDFWKPIKAESFYKDLSFLKPSTKPVLSWLQPTKNSA